MITNTVTEWRTAKGVSKAHMARRIGVKRSYMTKLEHGQLEPSGEMMFSIAEYLGQPVDQVFRHVRQPIPGEATAERLASPATGLNAAAAISPKSNFPSVVGNGRESTITPIKSKNKTYEHQSPNH